eukprot:TRINITY_DN24629_c0_g1_i2.p1 TRINITY_DN24629_c0_g1~~TRINITY_DN24629_c0_g1_i2.p1  ORF type:complete len:137 (-),score=46.82 TRINITY_DN24629_c0_g1_i2:101-511(-)
MKNYAAVTAAGLAAASSAKAAEAEEGTEEERSKAKEKAAGKMVEALWHATVIEISSLLYRVCKKATHDTDIEKEKRKKRAQGLYIAGEAFLKCSSAAGGGAMEEMIQRLGAVAGGPAESSEGSPGGGSAGYNVSST